MYNKKVKECCKNCRYCFKVKKRPIYDSIANKICLYFGLIGEGFDHILEVADYDTCEVFCLNEEKEDLVYEED